MNTEAFQACDIRGRSGPTLADPVSDAHAYLIGRALADRIPAAQPLLIAGDGRATTPSLLRMLETGFGRECTSLGAGVPTPLAYFARHALTVPNVVIVTASHQAASHNGFKIQLGDRPATPELIADLADRARGLFEAGERPPPTPVAGPPTAGASAAAWTQYQRALAATFPAVDGTRVVIDVMHGAYAGRAAAALRARGYTVTALRDEAASDFRGISPDPSNDGALAGLQAEVVGRGAAFGVALDGDGDRARLVDDRGRLVDNGTVLVLLYRWLGTEAGAVVCDQKLRLAVLRALRHAGATTIPAPSGHAFIRVAMLDRRALLGGEASGHFFWGEGSPYPVPAGDCGLFAALAVGDHARRTGRMLSDLCDEVPPSPYYSGDIRGLRYAGDRDVLLASVAATAAASGADVVTLDGVRLETPSSFAMLRPSVTEPDMLTAVLDADHAAALAAVRDRLAAALPGDARDIADAIASVGPDQS